MDKIKVLIMGAAGRDFHNFNVVYRDNPRYDVVAFTATQIPYIDDRKYPAALCGKLYPKGIPIYPESELIGLIKKHKVDEVVFAYSDCKFQYVMTKAAEVNAAGATFSMLGGEPTMVKSSKPVIAVVANRTGSGKSQTSRRVIEILMELGLKTVAVRHPMPYGDLVKQKVQRFATIADLKKHKCTIEEMEEYEPHVARGNVIYAGVDYEAILRQAEKEADVVIWDGGNNDLPFYKSDLIITVTDSLRPGHEVSYYPGLTNLILADVVVLNKIDSASPENIQMVRENIRKFNSKAPIIEAASPISLQNPADINLIKGKRVLVIEDGPTLTHGEMKYGAGTVAAMKFGAKEIVDPRKYAVKSIAETYAKYPNIGVLLPAMGYGPQQVKDLETTINRVPCDAVIIGTPIDLKRLVKIKKPAATVTYKLQEIGKPDLYDIISDMLKKKKRK
ncbi:MAG: cyclic 2,3-diphosphoglycerate synthase [Ignavibacteria bacterium]|jgi:predicted GTPase|nr:cyclic 2,3-diphosphoglycerate synthase [Ignavibacteria bacterium]